MKKDNSFLKAGAVLVVSGFVVKALSAVYRIPLTRMLGASAMGRYSAVFSLFMPFFAAASAGIVPCIAHFTAQSKNSPRGILTVRKSAAKLYISLSLIMAAAFVLFSRIYSFKTGDSFFLAGAVILAPAIVFAAVENICKGLTQGQMNMMPTAISNVMESVAKTALGLLSVWAVKNIMQNTSADMAVKAALCAVTVSGGICCVYLLWTVRQKKLKTDKKITSIYLQHRLQGQTEQKVNAKQLFAMSSPIAVSALVISAVNFFETAVCIPIISRIPYSKIVQSYGGASFKNAGDMAMYLLGIYQGMVLVVFNLLPAMLSAVGSASLPVISNAAERKNIPYLQRQTDRIFALTAAVSLPAAAYIFVFRSDILQFLFSTNPAQTKVSADLLAILMCSAVFCCFTSVFNSVLYGMGRSGTVFRILLTASVARCGVDFILCSIPQINIRAFAVSACLFYTIIFVMSIISIKASGIKLGFGKIFFMPFAATVITTVCAVMVTDKTLCFLPLYLKLGFSAVIFFLVYILIALITGIFVDIIP